MRAEGPCGHAPTWFQIRVCGGRGRGFRLRVDRSSRPPGRLWIRVPSGGASHSPESRRFPKSVFVRAPQRLTGTGGARRSGPVGYRACPSPYEGQVMKGGMRVALGVAAGYFLGRTRKMKVALMLAGAGATGRLPDNSRQLVREGIKRLGESAEVGKLTESVRVNSPTPRSGRRSRREQPDRRPHQPHRRCRVRRGRERRQGGRGRRRHRRQGRRGPAGRREGRRRRGRARRKGREGRERHSHSRIRDSEVRFLSATDEADEVRSRHRRRRYGRCRRHGE